MFGAKLPEDLSILIDNRDVTFLGGLIMRHQQIISNNIHSVRYRLSILTCTYNILRNLSFHIFRKCIDDGFLSSPSYVILFWLV